MREATFELELVANRGPTDADEQLGYLAEVGGNRAVFVGWDQAPLVGAVCDVCPSSSP